MDKLRLYTPHPIIPRHVLQERFEARPTLIKKDGWRVYRSIDRETGVHLTSTPNGLYVETNPTRIVNGNNYKQTDRKGMIDFVNAMNERYQPQTNFAALQVSAFDFNADVETKQKPFAYFTHLGELSRYNRTPEKKTGLRYTNKSNTGAVVLYDLHQKHGGHIPASEAEKNKLRIETSFNRNLQLNKHLQSMTTLNDYLTPHNYRKLPQLWLMRYEQVAKLPPFDNLPDLTTKEAVLLADIQLYGLDGLREKYRIENETTYRKRFMKVKTLLSRIHQHRQTKNLHSLVDELNEKVKQKAAELILCA